MNAAGNDAVLLRIDQRGEAGRVGYITVNRPQRRNALDNPTKEALAAAFEELARDDSLRVAVLTGAGEQAFIGGADVKEMASRATPAEPEDPLADRTHRVCELIRALPVPVIARINGWCIGAGVEIAASCDLRAGADTARFALPEVKFGLLANKESCLLPSLIGWGKTRELAFTGEPMDAAEAHRCGFLQKLVGAAELDAAVESWVAAICAASPRAVRMQKELHRQWEKLPIDEAIRAGLRANYTLKHGDDVRGRAQAFSQKRQ